MDMFMLLKLLWEQILYKQLKHSKKLKLIMDLL